MKFPALLMGYIRAICFELAFVYITKFVFKPIFVYINYHSIFVLQIGISETCTFNLNLVINGKNVSLHEVILDLPVCFPSTISAQKTHKQTDEKIVVRS